MMSTTHAVAPPASRPPVVVTAVLGGFALLLVAAVLLTWNFLWPRSVEPPSSVSLGPVAEFAPGSVRTFHLSPAGRLSELTFINGQPYGGFPTTGAIFHVVTYDDGGRIAFNAEYPHPYGCATGWQPDRQFEHYTGVFRDPCLGSTFTMEGRRIFGPAPRDMDRYGLSIETGAVVVHLNRLTEGEWRVQRAPSRPFGPP